MKELHILVAAFLIVTVLPGCAPAAINCAAEEAFCVGLVTDIGKVSDKSFNQSAWAGVQQAAKDLGATVNYIETADERDYVRNLAVFGDEGYDVVVTVGFTLGDATIDAAGKYPDTDFIGVDQFQAEPVAGVAGLVFQEDEAGFLVGSLAAMMSRSGQIGAVCGPDAVPAVWRFGEGYRAGAGYVDQQQETTTEVTVVYQDYDDKAFLDPEWGAEIANSLIGYGVDVIFGCGSLTGNGAIVAAAQVDAYVIGVDTDQYWTLPDAAPRMLTSAIKLITPGVYELIRLSKDGKFPSGNHFGQVGYAPFHDLEGEVPASVKSTLEEIRAGILNGSIDTGVPSEKP